MLGSLAAAELVVADALNWSGSWRWLELVLHAFPDSRGRIGWSSDGDERVYRRDERVCKRLRPEEVIFVRWLPHNLFLSCAKVIELMTDGTVCNTTDAKCRNSEEPLLNDAEREIIGVIRDAKRRMTTKEVLAKLEAKNGAVAQSTTKSTLATLVRRNLLTNRQDKTPKGYGLHEWD